MGSKMLRQNADVFSAAIAVLFLDILLYNYFLQTSTDKSNTLALMDVIIISTSIILGKKVARQSEFPVWKTNCTTAQNKNGVIASMLMGIGIIGSNTLILYKHNIDMIPWISFTGLYQPLALAMRAALTEEIVFRLLIFSAVYKFVNKISKSSTICFFSGMLVSAIAFGLLHDGFYLSFVFGIGLCYLYKNNGLIPAMLVHFLADFIPFILIYMK